MSTTTIKVHSETKLLLDKFREYRNESYDELIQKMVYLVKTADKEPMLCKDAINAIEKARERIKKGNFITDVEAKKRMGL